MDEQFGEYVVQKTVEAYGRVDVAVLAVGIGPPSNTLTASAEKIKFCMDANFGTFINFYVPIMRQMRTQKTECMIHPFFVDTEAVRNDGIPAPGEISEEKAAEYIINGIKKNKKRNMFPFTAALLTTLSVRVFSEWLITKVELAQTPKNY